MQTSFLLPQTSKDVYRSNSVAFYTVFLHTAYFVCYTRVALTAQLSGPSPIHMSLAISLILLISARAYVSLLHMTNSSLLLLFRLYTDVHILRTCLPTSISSVQHWHSDRLIVFRLRSHNDRATLEYRQYTCLSLYAYSSLSLPSPYVYPLTHDVYLIVVIPLLQ